MRSSHASGEDMKAGMDAIIKETTETVMTRRIPMDTGLPSLQDYQGSLEGQKEIGRPGEGSMNKNVYQFERGRGG